MKIFIHWLIILLLFSGKVFAGEGMWLPIFLKALNESDMKAMGMKISAEDIYSINKGSLKDAIVHFGGGCTSEVISDQGLMLTNHHCGYGYIQAHSSLEQNYMKDGFWAKSGNQELRCDGLTATFIISMEDVTAQALEGILTTMNETERNIAVNRNIEKISKSISRLPDQDVIVRAFFNGNQYFAFVTETYRDIRLVGTPPESIGKFGADTDNWIWPRHTGDFSLFRIYANSENRPADYSETNKPYKPRHFLPISMGGIREGDFNMVFGFPGRTNEYLSYEGVRQTIEVVNPIRITLRDKALSILAKHMREDPAAKIKYSAKYASISNAWKKWIGENQGVKFTNGLNKKKLADEDFEKRVAASKKTQEYGSLISTLELTYKQYEPLFIAKEFYAETFIRNIDASRLYQLAKRLYNNFEGRGLDVFNTLKQETLDDLEGLYANYDAQIDEQVFSALLEILMHDLKAAYIFPHLRDKIKEHGSATAFIRFVYKESPILDKKKMNSFLQLRQPEWKIALQADPLWQLFEELDYFLTNDINKNSGEYEDQISILRRTHMKALLELYPERKFYPDANSTLRVTFGKVEGFKPRDGVWYEYRTYLDGVIEKYVPGDYEFDVHPKLLELYQKKDYGMYGENGKMPLAFIASNHTAGGNSGSPAIDANGNLVGLNFDRVWEGTMSDINYDPRICRNILVDVRYILFVIDKFAGAGHLINEMKLVYPKAKNKKRKKAA